MKILIVDDNMADLFLAVETFEELGTDAEILTAKDGDIALEMIDEHVPEVVLLDVKMPRVEGYEVLQEIRKKYKDKITVIMLTTSTAEEDIMKSKKLKADAYIQKPLMISEFQDKLSTVDNVYIKKLCSFIHYPKIYEI